MSITVDDDFARFGSKSYAINKINSVEVRELKPHSEQAAILCGVIAVVLVLAWLNSLGGEPGVSWGSLVVGAIFAAIAWKAWEKAKLRDYHLYLMTSSSEAQAFKSRNEAEVLDLRDRIEAAMARSGRGGQS